MEKGKKNKKQVIIGISVLLLITLLLLGLTYAYYRTRIIGNTNSESINVTSKNLEVEYDDDSASVITDTGISPGKKITKTFKVKNNGDEEASYSIKLDNVENTFVRFNDWKYKLYKGETTSASPIAEGIIGHGEEQTIKSYETVTSLGTNTYTLEIEYENSTTEDQSMDMGHTLSLRVNIGNSIGDELRNAPQGTLLHAIGENNPNIISPVTIPGREASGVVFGVMGEKVITIGSSYQNDYWTYGTGYEYNPETGGLSLTGVQVGVYKEIYTQLPGKYLVSGDSYGNSSSTREPKRPKNLSAVYQVTEATKDKITYKKLSGENLFKEAELSYTEDDYGTSYYYRGAVENNYVTFADMCWRIVRVQGDGSIKITLYDEQHPCSRSEDNGKGVFISENGEGEIVWFTAVATGLRAEFRSGPTEAALLQWYNFPSIDLGKYQEKIEQDAEWCNDLSETDAVVYDVYYFGAYKRLNTDIATGPSLKCRTLNENNEESIYTGKIGLLSADEITFSGLLFSDDYSPIFYLPDSYLLKNTSDYVQNTLTPFESGPDGSYRTIVALTGTFLRRTADSSAANRPTLVLPSSTLVLPDGSGTKESPYVIE